MKIYLTSLWQIFAVCDFGYSTQSYTNIVNVFFRPVSRMIALILVHFLLIAAGSWGGNAWNGVRKLLNNKNPASDID